VKRLLWLVVGVGAGAVVGNRVIRSARQARERYAPSSVAKRAGSASVGLMGRLKEAFEEGRAEMALREAELRAEIGLPVT
jgi:hypothetical protein